MLMDIKMSTIVDIKTFISMQYFMLMYVEHEKGSNNKGRFPGGYIFSSLFSVLKPNYFIRVK